MMAMVSPRVMRVNPPLPGLTARNSIALSAPASPPSAAEIAKAR
jgi:hypothetical protein